MYFTDLHVFFRLPGIYDFNFVLGTSVGFLFQVRKGDSIGVFLRAVQLQLAPEFREIRTTSVENLLYVKEDLIIPHVRLLQIPFFNCVCGYFCIYHLDVC